MSSRRPPAQGVVDRPRRLDAQLRGMACPSQFPAHRPTQKRTMLWFDPFYGFLLDSCPCLVFALDGRRRLSQMLAFKSEPKATAARIISEIPITLSTLESLRFAAPRIIPAST